jgi:hypothetical protein
VRSPRPGRARSCSERPRCGRHAGSPARPGALRPLADGVGVAKLSRLARTVKAWGAEILGLACHRRRFQRAPRGRQPADQEGQAGRHGFRTFANVRLRLLLHCGVSWPTHRTARLRSRSPRSTASRRYTTTLRRLIGSSVVVGPASRSRRHERRSGMVVSRRSGKRPPRWAARRQARVGSGSASPPPVAPTVPASPRSLSQFGLARLVSAGRRADAARLGGLREGP